ncbi:MAG: hypothetical protein ACI9DK_001631 [Vicingaceae bacterium]|jgi:hypothetical protein
MKLIFDKRIYKMLQISRLQLEDKEEKYLDPTFSYLSFFEIFTIIGKMA